ncbi:MAG: YncE family protein [Desulfuromonadaceae bacterium]|nr:YncE family protein [Desulfuromonadaceae bacterium]
MGVKWNRYPLLLAAVLLLSSCALTPMPQIAYVDPGATLHLYLQPIPQEAHQLSLTVTGLSARTVDGRDIPLLDAPWVLNPAERVGRQTKLLQHKLPVGEYLGLSLVLSEATLQTEEGPIDLLVDAGPQLIAENFVISADQTQTLFLSLHPKRLVTGGYKLTAQFSLWKAQSPLAELQGIISHPNSGLLTVFEKKTPTLVELVAVGREPAGVALDQHGRLVYLALSGENSIAVFDLVRDKVQRKVRLHMGDRPTELALSADGATLISLNSGSNSVSIIDTDSFSVRQRLLFSTTPASIFTGVNSRNAYVSLPDINALALLDLERAAVIATANLTDTATQGVADRTGRQVYLLTENSPNLLTVSADNLAITDRVYIGYGARCLALNLNNDLLYVGMESGEIAVIDPRVGLPIDSFNAAPGVVDIAVDQEENSLFVVSAQGNLLSKYDLVSKKRLAVLELGTAGAKIAVMGER